MTAKEDWREFATGGKDDSEEAEEPTPTDSDPDPDVWDWGVLLDKEGNVIEPGACEGYHTDE